MPRRERRNEAFVSWEFTPFSLNTIACPVTKIHESHSEVIRQWISKIK
jgi:hypothetical protein